MTLFERDGTEVEALLTDRYLERVLARATSGPEGGPVDAGFDPVLRDAAERLRRHLVRVHPSFRFEERLAARLASEAAATQLAPAAGAEGSITAIPVTLDGEPNEDDGFRPLLIGGALTSAALSIAGAAYVAWRRARPSRLGRVARATRQRERGTAARAR